MSNPNARKPYMNRRHVSEAFRIPDRYIKDVSDKESEFEKPYLDSSYQQMHLNIPAPDWGSGVRVPRIRTRHPQKSNIWIDPRTSVPGTREIPEIGYGTSCVGCLISCTGPPDCETPGASVECRALQFCTQDPTGWGRDTSWSLDVLLGAALDDRPGSWNYPSIEFEVDTTQAQFVVIVCFTDGLGYTCCEDIDITCCDCLTASSPTASGGSIAPGGSLAVSVSGGCAPYTWGITGAGYSIRHGATEGTGNLVEVVGGDCGVDYAATATLSVVDFCGNSDTVTITNTGGQWNQVDSSATNKAGATNCIPPFGCGGLSDEYISGNQRWLLDSGVCWKDGTWSWVSGPDPPCGDPLACSLGPGTCAGSVPADCTCIPLRKLYYEWGCAP